MNIDCKGILSSINVDSYDLIALIIPTICNILFGIIFWWSYLQSYTVTLSLLDWNMAYIKIIGIFILLILIHFVSKLFRFISKELIEKLYYGKNLYKFPTVSFLLPNSNEVSNLYREKIVAKIDADFGINLSCTVKSKKQKLEFIRTANDAIDLVRKQVRDSQFSSMYLRKNIRYGTCRNFIGGSIILIIIELVYMIFYLNGTESQPIIQILLVHSFAMIISCIQLPKLGKEYAKELYDNYLNIQK